MANQQSESEYLKTYNIHDFDTPLVTVDMAIFTVRNEQLEVLLTKRAQHPCLGQWALPGGFIDLTSDRELLDTARRKLKEKTGVDAPYLEQVGTYGNANRDPRGWSVTVAYMALVSSDEVSLSKDDSSEEVAWVAVEKAKRKSSLAFDHEKILEACSERLRNKVEYTSLPVHLLPDAFTLTELQHIFEIVLGTTVEKKSFRRRILDADILEETGEMKTGSNRPAKLYRSKPEGENHFFSRNLEGPR